MRDASAFSIARGEGRACTKNRCWRENRGSRSTLLQESSSKKDSVCWFETLETDGRGVRRFVRRAKGQGGGPVAGLPSDGSLANWLSLLGRFQASVMMILNVLEASWSIVVASTQRRFRRVYRRRETSLHPRYKATVVHRVSRRGAGISSDRILSVEPLVLLESAKLGSIAGSRDFSISAALVCDA